MKPPNPLMVSVIIPTYNRAELVTQAIDSLLTQTRAPDEILVVDDGSTDQTREILAQYASPVHVIFQENQGRSRARNNGLQIAQGDLIAFLDSDDYLPPGSIERRAYYLETHPTVGLIYSDARLVTPQNKELELFSIHYPVPHPSGMIFAELAKHNMLVLSSVMVRRICLGDITFDEAVEPAEDFDVWLKLAVRCEFAYISEPLVYYRVPLELISSQNFGLPGSSALGDKKKAELSQLEVQQRVFAMPAFQQLGCRQQAQIYCSHGIKKAMLPRLTEARYFFWKAIRIAPLYPLGHVLLLVSLLGLRVLQALILFRRYLVGNRSWKGACFHLDS